MSATTSLLRSMTLAFALAAALPGPAPAGMAGSIVAIFTPAPAGCTWALLDPESREERVYSRSAACPDLLVWDPAGRRTVYVDGDRVLQLDWRAGAAPAELGRLPPSAAPPQDAVDQTLWLAAGTGAVRIARFARAEGPAQWLEPGVLGVPYGGRLHPLREDATAYEIADAAVLGEQVAGDGALGVLLVDELRNGAWERVDEPAHVLSIDRALNDGDVPGTLPGMVSLARLRSAMLDGESSPRLGPRDGIDAAALRGLAGAYAKRIGRPEPPSVGVPTIEVFALGEAGVLTDSAFGDVFHLTGPLVYCRPGCSALGAKLDLGAIPDDTGLAIAAAGPFLLVQGADRDGTPHAAVYRYPELQPLTTVVGLSAAVWLPNSELWELIGPTSLPPPSRAVPPAKGR